MLLEVPVGRLRSSMPGKLRRHLSVSDLIWHFGVSSSYAAVVILRVRSSSSAGKP